MQFVTAELVILLPTSSHRMELMYIRFIEPQITGSYPEMRFFESVYEPAHFTFFVREEVGHIITCTALRQSPNTWPLQPAESADHITYEQLKRYVLTSSGMCVR